MGMQNSFYARLAPHIISLTRIMVALLFLEHGTMKLFGFPPGMGPVKLASFMGFSGLLEFVGALLLLIGLATRLSAFILSGEMAVAYFMVHAKMGFFPVLNHGELAAVYCFTFLFFFAVGGGAWSLDRFFQRSQANHASQEAVSKV